MANELMFQIGIQEVKEKIDEIRNKFDSFNEAYGDGKGITVKLNLQSAIGDAEALVNALKSVGNADALKPYEQALSQVKQKIESTGKASKEASKEQEISIERAQAMLARYRKQAFDVSNQMRDILSIQRAGGKDGAYSEQLMKAFSDFNRLRHEINKIASASNASEAVGLGMSSENLSKLIANFGMLKSAYKDVIAEADKFNKTQDKDLAKAEVNIKKLGIAFNSLKDYMKTNGGSEEMKRLQNEIQVAIQKMRQLMNAGDYSGAQRVYERISGVIKQASAATREYDRAKHQSISSTSQLTAEEQRLANAIKGSTDSMRGQSQILGDLKSMAMQYLGVWGAQGFLRNVIEIGGQLEMQRLSIGAILGDMAKANDLFDKIKNLAIKSPFGVVELDQMTKQLSAYGFEYKELFDMTKRLADISAATGTGVDRLALALGHVRSEAALSGYTLRQFSMANIPLAKKLSEHLSEVEGKFVSIAEVRKRVRAKDIGYEDVLKVLKDLTDEGGMFYNAQEKMSESVKAKFKNLKDSMDIMYGEIAESSVGSGLKNVANLLTTLTRHWQELGAVLVAGAGSWAINRIAMMATNKAMVQGNLMLGRFSAAQLETAAITKNLTREQLLQAVATKRLSVADAEAAGAVFLLSKAQLQHVANTGKVSAAMNMATLATSKYTVSQLRMIASWRTFNFGWLAQGLLGITNGAKAAALAVGGMLKVFWPMLALSAVAEVFFSLKREQEQFAESANYVGQSARQMMKDINDAMNTVTKNGKPVDTEALREAVNTMKEVVEQSEFYTDEQQKQVDKASTLSEKYDVLLKQMKEMREEAQWQTNSEELFQKVLSNTGKRVVRTETAEFGETISFGLPFFNNSLSENIEQVNKHNSELSTAISLLAEYQDVMQTAIEKNNGFGLSLEGKSWQEQIRLIAESGHWDEFVASVENAGSRFEKMTDNVKDAADKVRDDWDGIVKDDFEAIKLTLMQQFDMTEAELNEWAKNNERTYRWFVDGIIKAVSKLGLAEDVLDSLKQKLLNLFSLGGGKKPEKREPTPYELQTDLGKRILGNVIRANKNNGKGGQGVLTVKEVNQITGTGEHQKTESEVVKTLKENAQKDLQTMNDVEKIYGKTSQKYIDAKKKFDRSLNIAKANGITESEIRSGKYKTKTPKQVTDEETKEIREQVRIMKEAADSYQYWRDKVGDGSAFAHVKSEFGDLLKQYNLDSTNVKDLRANLEKLRKEVEARPVSKARTEALKEIDKEMAQLDRKDFEKDTEKWVSALSRDLDELTRKWDIFNSVVSETGDRMLAARLTGITPGATPADLKRLNVSSFAGVNIDFDSVLGMSDEQIDRYVETLGVSENRIKAIKNGLKDWKKAQQDVTKSDIQNYAKWLGSLVDIESIRMRNQEEYNQILEETNRLLKQGIITQEEADKRRRGAEVKRDTKNWQATSMYSNLYNRSQYMAQGEFYEAYNKERASLFDQYKQNAITIQDYTEKMRKLNKVASEFSSQGFLGIKGGLGAFLGGGYQGLIDYHRGKADYLRSIGKEDEAQQEDDKANSEEKQLKTANQLMKAFQDLASGADLLGDLFDSIGWSDGANAMKDAGTLIGKGLSGAQSLSMLGPWGMAAGAGLGLVSGIFQLYDTWKQREIDALKENVNALKENTDSIKTARNRTLGYDTGDLRRRMAQQYSYEATRHKVWNQGALGTIEMDIPDLSQIAMRYYYERNSNKSSYEAELENLKEQRKYYLEMYNLENEKKNVSNESLREYREQIAKLDDQILFFVEDLTKEMWGIDFESWASQISDALWTAFENGEDALDAFHDSAKDIIADVAKRMMNIHLIEPVFSKLEDMLFGEIGSNGQRSGGAAYDRYTGEFNEQETLRILGQFFGEDGEFAKVINSAEDFYNMAQRVTGFDFSSDGGSSSSTGSGIKSITEQTADLLASYINAIRADVSVNRAMIAEYFPMYYAAITSGNASLRNIENHTSAIMDSNERIASSVSELQSDIRGLKNKAWKMPVA